jgi:transposase
VAQIPAHVERVLESIEQLSNQIRAADKELAELASQDGTCQRLMTVPGVGPVTAVRFAAIVDDVERFGNAHQAPVPDIRWKRRGLPGSWGTIVYCPALRPRRITRAQPLWRA